MHKYENIFAKSRNTPDISRNKNIKYPLAFGLQLAGCTDSLQASWIA
jgi:hypothetical protein